MSKTHFTSYQQILNVDYRVYAHRKKEAFETLEEHTQLCEYYFMKMNKVRGFDTFFENSGEMFGILVDPASAYLYENMVYNTISFHDFGKTNPGFQIIKMKNKDPLLPKKKNRYDSKHSMLSSSIYLNHFINLIQEANISKKDKIVLMGLCLVNSFVISRHHSHLSDIMSFINEFCEDGTGYDIFQEFTDNPILLKDKKVIKSYKLKDKWNIFLRGLGQEAGIGLFVYSRYLYSILVTCDYYATSEFQSGLRIHYFGDLEEKEEFINAYEEAELTKKIRNYEKDFFNKDEKSTYNDINVLRTEMFLETERALISNPKECLFFIEAPTGIGKSNAAMNLGFHLLKGSQRRIYYVYPFNTLVEQNVDSLKKVFGEHSPLFYKITVLNSITPIKYDKKKTAESEEGEDSQECYGKALLDRQFLNYPFVLTTHISLFQTMFGEEREAVFGFSQLKDSIIVLDEIQSYKNTIWSEIIVFLKVFAKTLNLKIIIMSATLPDLNCLTEEDSGVVYLLKNRNKYYFNPLFRERVKISYELLDQEMDLEFLKEHVRSNISENKKVVVEFIKKASAYKFYEMFAEEKLEVPLYLMTGDDNQPDREDILKAIRKEGETGALLIATQVIEAGVDIDMDIGYKDISKLDSEEQFLGRINRSCKKSGIVYFFDLDSMKSIYGNDLRINKEFALPNEKMKEILVTKEFHLYYEGIMKLLKENYNKSNQESWNLEHFFCEEVKGLNFPEVRKRMELIEEDAWNMQVFFNRIISVKEKTLNGEQIWEEYKELLMNNSMDYAEKRVKLSEVRSKMTYFIYSIKKDSDFPYSDRIGELYYITNGEDYFMNGKLNRRKLEDDGAVFFV